LKTKSGPEKRNYKVFLFSFRNSLVRDFISKIMKRQTWKTIVSRIVLGSGVALTCFLSLCSANRGEPLADGSRIKIRNVVVAEEVSFDFPDNNPVHFMARVVPAWIRSILPLSLRSKLSLQENSGLHMSGENKVCLFIVTARDSMAPTSKLDVRRLTISDDRGQGTNSSAALVTVDMGQKFQGWAWEDFPKNSRNLIVRCWGAEPNGQPAEMVQFKIRNPGYEPEPKPKAL
jgi:hypothetical protein